MRGLASGRRRAKAELGVELAFIFDLGRSWAGGPSETHRWASLTVDLAIEYQHEGVVALGLGGPEDGHPPEPFAGLFERGRAAGLRSAPHPANTPGQPACAARSRRSAPTGLRMASAVSKTRRRRSDCPKHRIVLDICPTSNVRLGVYPSLLEHPLKRLVAAGCR